MSIIDRKYYEVASPGSISEQILISARNNIYDDFLLHMTPRKESTILDVGVSDVLTDGANLIERKYEHPEMITACGLGESYEFQKAFPMIAYTKIEPNVRLPFPDRHFDIATANAVLEHVGSNENQRMFVAELSRVARNVFITVPNRMFPVEHHTGIPIVHYSDFGFRLACKVVRKSKWADENNLILMSLGKLTDLSSKLTGTVDIGHTGIRLGPFSSNLYLSVRR